MSNHLKGESSPYLLQHAENPVDWYTWGQEALDIAKEQDKPILLSIGYSACHWCHVMAHESFEDPETAEIMNKHFINIKVDREERPDLDKIYQTAHYLLLSRQGGWPLNMFLSPDSHIPFFGGTYFPPEAKHGIASFKEVLEKIVEFYQKNREEIKKQNELVQKTLDELQKSVAKTDELNSAPIDASYERLFQQYDKVHGGFSVAPKFPQATNIERLFHYWSTTKDSNALDMALATLSNMANGGIYDHIGGGFFRYSVDNEWMIPHFEKMLYDNGPLLSLYAQAFKITQDPQFKNIAIKTAEWIQREMQSDDGGYFSSLDADTDGKEGTFYLWDLHEISEVLDDDERQIVLAHFGLASPANFQGKWHLYVNNSLEQLTAELNLDEFKATALIDTAKVKLLKARAQRTLPGKDEKILSSWNGLMIKGMAQAGLLLDKKEFVESAQKALDFIKNNLWKDGRLFSKFKDGQAGITAYLDDYVFLIDGILNLLQAHWNTQALLFAIELAETVIEYYQDEEHGDFYFTANDHEALIQRPKPLIDESTPSGNGVAAHSLGRLGHLIAETKYLDASEKVLKMNWDNIMKMPQAFSSLLHALDDYINAPQIIIIRGENPELEKWKKLCNEYYAPYRMVFAIPNSEENLPGLLAERKAEATTIAYACSGQKCIAPIKEFSELQKFLESS